MNKLLFLLVFLSAQVHAGLIKTSVIADSGNISFSMLFNESIDLFVTDEYGRQKDGFQFWMSDDTSATRSDVLFYGLGSSIVRGSEIFSNGSIPVCSVSSAGGSNCGGWGDVSGVIDFNITGFSFEIPVPREYFRFEDELLRIITIEAYLLTFSVPAEMLGLDPENPQGRWFLETYEYGSCAPTDCKMITSTVPEPGTFGLLGLGLGCLAWMRRKKR